MMTFFILKSFPENKKKMKFSMNADKSQIFMFCCFQNFAYLGIKSVNFWISGILILHFKGFSIK